MASPQVKGGIAWLDRVVRARIELSTFGFSVLRWWQWPTVVLGVVRAWLLAVAILPTTWRGWDPHRPAVPGGHVYLRHDAQMFRLMLLVHATAGPEPVCQPWWQLHIAILPRWPLFGRTRTLNAAGYCAPVSTVWADQKQDALVAGARDTAYGSDGWQVRKELNLDFVTLAGRKLPTKRARHYLAVI